MVGCSLQDLVVHAADILSIRVPVRHQWSFLVRSQIRYFTGLPFSHDEHALNNFHPVSICLSTAERCDHIQKDIYYLADSCLLEALMRDAYLVRVQIIRASDRATRSFASIQSVRLPKK